MNFRDGQRGTIGQNTAVIRKRIVILRSLVVYFASLTTAIIHEQESINRLKEKADNRLRDHAWKRNPKDVQIREISRAGPSGNSQRLEKSMAWKKYGY